jgi:hypothetical protein
VLAGAASPDFQPMRDEAGVSAGLDAQLRGAKVLPFIHMTLVESDGDPGIFGEKVAPPRRGIDQLSQGVEPGLPAQVTVPGPAGRGRCDASPTGAIVVSTLHSAILELMFDDH